VTTNATTLRLYDSSFAGLFYSPFCLTIDPMARLMLINITADPDDVYIGFEPQVFDDPVHGRGLLVIAYLRDDRCDIYHQAALRLDRAAYDIVGRGLRELVARPFDGARFDVTPRGVDLDIAFDDLHGRPIHLRIIERGRPTRPFAILAPMGNTAEKPPALPLFFLHGFYFVRRAGTELLIAVDGRAHRPDSIPMLLDGARVHFLRYAAEPFLVNWNPAHDGDMTARPLASDASEMVDGPLTYHLAWRDGQPEIAALALGDGRHALRAVFDPPFPHAVALADGAAAAGTFAITTDGAGSVSGRYSLAHAAGAVEIVLHPVGGWQPAVKRWSVRLIFGLVPLFKRWPMTYRWVGRVELGERPALRGAWERLGREGQGRVIKLFGD